MNEGGSVRRKPSIRDKHSVHNNLLWLLDTSAQSWFYFFLPLYINFSILFVFFFLILVHGDTYNTIKRTPTKPTSINTIKMYLWSDTMICHL